MVACDRDQKSNGKLAFIDDGRIVVTPPTKAAEASEVRRVGVRRVSSLALQIIPYTSFEDNGV
jgi:hypothetical protein